MIIPKSYNYIGAFLTYNCNLNCSYCINHFDYLALVMQRTAGEWVDHLKHIPTTPELPITLQGGEPTCLTGFYWLVNRLHKQGAFLDLLTNGDFNPYYFAKRISPEVFKRPSKYANIRFSYHVGAIKIQYLAKCVKFLQDEGYSVGIWALDHPSTRDHVSDAKRYCEDIGIDFRVKEFLGWYNEVLYGTYKYPNAIQKPHKVVPTEVYCKPSELLINPEGFIFRCTRDLYANENSIGHIRDKRFKPPIKFAKCKNFGNCNPCDIKLKFNRFQELGHCSVEIKKGG